MPDAPVSDADHARSPWVSVWRPLVTIGNAPLRLARGYRPGWLGPDLFAALTVALVALPQSMAFAEVAGLRPEVGLYAMIVAAVVGGLLTSSRQVSIGPTNTMAIMAGSALLVMSVPGGVADPAQKAVFIAGVAVLAGVIQVLLALARMGELVRYVSQSVLVGFAAGAGVLIAINQVPAFLGIPLDSTDADVNGVPKTVVRLIETATAPDGRAVLIGVASLVVALGCRLISRWLPAHLLAVVVGGLIVWLAGWGDGRVDIVGELPRGLPGFAAPPTDVAFYRAMIVPALAIALVGMLDIYGIGKTLAGRSGQRVNAEQDFVTLGVTNIVTGLFRGMPISASYSRSALNADAGSRTQAAGILSGVITAVLFLALAPAAQFIPMASIAAILFVIAYGLIDWRYVRRIVRSNHADLAVCVGTFVATLLIPLEQAVFVGVFLNIALYLRRARQVYVLEMVRDEASPTGLIERPLKQEGHEGGVVFLQLEGNLFFAASDDLQDRFHQVMHSGAKAVILRLKRTHMVDATIMHVLQQFARQMHERGGHVLLCGVRERMKHRMIEFGLTEVIPEDHIFTTRNDLFASAKAAIQRARELTGHDLIQREPARRTAEPAWNYEI